MGYFDEFGNLAPYEVQMMELEEFEAFFVGAFGQSSSRRRLFDNYLRYVEELRTTVGAGFWQWVDGSFVANKLNPRDIDFVTFLDGERYERYTKELTAMRAYRLDKERGTDGYFVGVYEPTHARYGDYDLDRREWLFTFGTTRTPKRNKGIVQLNY
jgi:hypothetical protein